MLAAAQATWRKAEEDEWEKGNFCAPLRLPRDILAGAAYRLYAVFLGGPPSG